MSDWDKDPFAGGGTGAGGGRTNGFDDDVRFRFTRFRDLELDTAPAYTVDEMIPRVGVVIVWGKRKSGKTFWVYDLEMHVALDWEYRGRRVEPGAVLHIACEGVRGLGARKEAWRLHHLQGKDAGAIAQIDAAPFYLCKDTALDLIKDADKVIADIGSQFVGRPIRMITIDTLNRSLRGSESKDEDMSAYIRAAILLADHFQCVVIIIHHCGWNEERPRGHSSLLGSADALIETKKDTDGNICTEVEEMRDGPSGATTHSKLVVVEVALDVNGNPITSCVIVPDPAAAAQAKEKAKGKPPSPIGQKFYDALVNVVAANGIAERRAASNDRLSITEDQWIAELVRHGLLEPLPDENDKAALRTARNRRGATLSKYRSELISLNVIACNGKIMWSTRKEH
jgi:hypothetical protein